MKMVLRLLTEAEYKATLSGQMVDIKGREDEVHPDGVLDVHPYLQAVEASIEPLQLLPDAPLQLSIILSPEALATSSTRATDQTGI